MRYFALAAGLVIIAYLVMNFNSRTADLNQLTAEHAIVKAERDAKLQTKAALNDQIAFATSEAAVHRWAYENHMVRPGDIPVVPVAAANPTPTVIPKPAATQVKTSMLDHWLLLFIDPE